MNIAHVYQLYAMNDEDFRRHSVAKRSWFMHLRPAIIDRPFEVSDTLRTADKLVGDSRDVPYINDILDYAFQDPAIDAVMFTNSDIGFLSSPVAYLKQQLSRHGCALLRRLDYGKLATPPSSVKGGVIGGGADLFAMTRDWWEQRRSKLPLMFVGTEGFDFILIAEMFKSGVDVKNPQPLIFHERHDSFWKKDRETLVQSPAQLYNRNVCATWAHTNGFGYMVNPDKNGFLFKELKLLRPVKHMKFDLGIAVLGRFGDIINVLPIAKKYADYGQKIAWAVLPEYANIFDGISYVTPIVVKTRLANVAQGIRELKKLCVNVQSWQMYGNPAVGRRTTSSFALEMWRMAGAAAEFESLPLVFDKRNTEREQQLVARVLQKNQKPLLFSGKGTSSPFPHTVKCFAAIKEVAKKYDCEVVDISNVSAHRIYDMLGVFEASRGIVVIDSAYLHLTYASKTPTFALTSEGPEKDRSSWYGAQAREQWRAAASYSNWQKLLPELDAWFQTPVEI